MHVHAQTAIRARRPLHNWAMNGINSKHLFILLLGSLDGFLSAPGTRHPAPGTSWRHSLLTGCNAISKLEQLLMHNWSESIERAGAAIVSSLSAAYVEIV